MDVKDPTMSFAKSRQAIAGTIAKFRIKGPTFVDRQAWSTGFMQNLGQASPGRPHKNVGIIVAVEAKEEIVQHQLVGVVLQVILKYPNNGGIIHSVIPGELAHP